MYSDVKELTIIRPVLGSHFSLYTVGAIKPGEQQKLLLNKINESCICYKFKKLLVMKYT